MNSSALNCRIAGIFSVVAFLMHGTAIRCDGQERPSVSVQGKPEMIMIPADSPQLRQLRTEVVRVADIPRLEVTAPGRIGVDVGRVGRVMMPVPGRIDRVLVRLGDRIEPGQLLLTVDSPDADGAVTECRQAEAAVLQARSSVTKAQADYDRAKDLLDHKAVAQKEVLAGEHELTQARAELEHAVATLTHNQRRLEILGLREDEPGQKLSVRATLAGKVLDLAVTPGEYRTDTNVPLMIIADLSTVLVTSEVPESSIRLIDVGEKVQLELVAYPGETFDARVTRIADTVDAKTRTIQVQAELSNPRGRLRPEMFGRIRHSHRPRSVPVVPAEAVVQSARGASVFVERGPGMFQRIYVQTEEPLALGIPVLQGVKAGDRVVVSGVMLLSAGRH
jgi:membrane fusion protein, heavy metal efflux system